MNRPPPRETVIVGAEISAGHDGAAQLTLTLRYENDVTAAVVVGADVGFSLMRNCGAVCLADLAGQSWRNFLEGAR